jgi:hypothetical protein
MDDFGDEGEEDKEEDIGDEGEEDKEEDIGDERDKEEKNPLTKQGLELRNKTKSYM